MAKKNLNHVWRKVAAIQKRGPETDIYVWMDENLGKYNDIEDLRIDVCLNSDDEEEPTIEDLVDLMDKQTN